MTRSAEINEFLFCAKCHLKSLAVTVLIGDVVKIVIIKWGCIYHITHWKKVSKRMPSVLSLANLRGGGGTRDMWPASPLLVQILSFSCSFREKFGQIIDWCHHLGSCPAPRVGCDCLEMDFSYDLQNKKFYIHSRRPILIDFHPNIRLFVSVNK